MKKHVARMMHLNISDNDDIQITRQRIDNFTNEVGETDYSYENKKKIGMLCTICKIKST